MKPLIIGCRTLENELRASMKKCGVDYPVIWIEARLHNVKEKLNHSLQQIIDSAENCSEILFATGFCGNSVLNLKSRGVPLILPRVDDCTSLLFGSCSEKLKWIDSYFLTEGWLKGEQNIWAEYNYAVEKYGAKRASRIFDMIFAHYNRVVLLDTGCYDLSGSFPKAQKIAEAFSLDCQVIPVLPEYLELLLTGPWDDRRFLTVPPHTSITSSNLTKLY